MLNESDRHRIQEEERYRAQVRATIKPQVPGDMPNPKGLMKPLLILGGIVLAAGFVIWGNAGSEPGIAKDEPRVDVTLSSGLICGKTQENMYQIIGGAQQNDLPGVYRMTERGDAIQLKPATRVTTLMHEGKLVLISIASGVHANSSCWAVTANVR